jgi:hypothetical protein
VRCFELSSVAVVSWFECDRRVAKHGLWNVRQLRFFYPPLIVAA